MKWNDLRLAQKFQLGFGTLIIILITVSIISVSGVRNLIGTSLTVTKAKDLQSKILDSYKKHLLWSQELSRTIYTDYKDKVEVELVYTNCAFGKWYYGEDRRNAEELIPALKSLFSKIEGPHKRLHDAAKQISEKYDGIKGSNDQDEIKNRIEDIHKIYETEIISQLGEIGEIFTEAFEMVDNQVVIINNDYIQYSNKLKLTVILICILSSLLAALIAWAISSGILANVRKGLAYTQQVATGDLSVKIDVNSNDEVGMLIKSVTQMVSQISIIINDVIEGVEVFSNASKQLTNTSQNVSQGASEQAAGAEEISSSIEEMAANIEQNSENSKEADSISRIGAEQIKKGSSSVNQTVSSMKEIATKVSIISDIAFQTNILALNAAVEAARAGEYGRGFAVVAAEVRKLAERSKIAADEINRLSTSGVAIAEEAGKMLESLVPQIERAANIVQEITAASLEQKSGASQINNAIQQLNSVTQQNASVAEEMSSSAEEISSQAEITKQRISYFKT